MTAKPKHCVVFVKVNRWMKSHARVGFVRSTIYGHLIAAIECGKIGPESWDRFFTSAQEKEIAAAFRQVIDGKLSDISALVGGKYDIGELRVFRAFTARRFGRALSRN